VAVASTKDASILKFTMTRGQREPMRWSPRRLARYICEHGVEQIYSCWSGDEGEPQEFQRQITPADLVADDFFFRERELLTVELLRLHLATKPFKAD
jgi:hypothetical protein